MRSTADGGASVNVSKLGAALVVAAAIVSGCDGCGDKNASPGQPASSSASSSSFLVRLGGVAVVTGSRGPEEVRERASSAIPDIRACCEEGAKANPDLRGQLNVDAIIEPSGNVKSAGRSAGVFPEAVSACLVRAVQSVSFGPSEGGEALVTIAILCGIPQPAKTTSDTPP